MPLIIGVTPGGVLVPVLVDANGVVSVSSAVSSLPSLPAGDNNIGNVDIVSLPALAAGDNNIGNVDVVTLPMLATGTNLIGKIQSNNFGFVNAALHKDPIRFGYSAPIARSWQKLNIPAADSEVPDGDVPAGEIWVITNITALISSSSMTILRMGANIAGTDVWFWEEKPPTTLVYYDRQGWWVLGPGDHLFGYVYGATLNDDFYGRASGFRVDIDQ